jgi:hypothetical protein
MAIFFPSDAKAKDAPGGPEQQVLDALKNLDDTWYVIPISTSRSIPSTCKARRISWSYMTESSSSWRLKAGIYLGTAEALGGRIISR